MQNLAGIRVHHLNGIGIRGADIEHLVIMREGHTARALAGRIGFDHLLARHVNDADRIVLLIRHPDFIGE